MFLKQISGKELEENLDAYRVYDVRSPEEYASGHIPGSINIPYDEVLDYFYEIKNSEKPIVIYCRTTKRSTYAASLLANAGIINITIAPGVSLYNYKLEY